MGDNKRGAGMLRRGDLVRLHRELIDRGFPFQVLHRAPDLRPPRRSFRRAVAVPFAFGVGICISYVVTLALTSR